MVVETRQIARAMKLRRHEEEHREAVQRHAFRDRQTARRQRQQRQTAKERAKGKKGSTALSSPVFLQTEESIVKVDTTTAAAAATVTAATAAASSFSTSEGESGRVDLLNSLGSAIPEPTETVEEKRAERIDDSIAQAKVRLNEKYARQVAAFASKRQYYERLNTMQRKDDALNLIKFRKAEIARRKALFEESEGKLADLVDLDVHRIANGHGMKDASKIFLETNANVQSLLEMHLEAQFEDGFTHVAQAAADAEASLKTEGRSQLRSGSKALTSARVMQMLAAIVDPIMAQVPPEMMKLGINAIEQPVIGVLKDVMSDMLLEYFIPKATKKLLEMPWKDIPDTDIELLGSGKVEVAESEPVNQETRYAIDMSTKSDFASQLINAVLSNYLPQTIETMHQVLDKEVYETAHRVVPKAAAREITYNLVKLVSDMMIKKIFHLVTHSMTMRATPLLTKIISQTLINSVSLTLTRALTRAPVGDFFCQLCRAKEQEEPNLSEFCDACWSSETAGYYADYYTAYYAHYYTHYYNWYYGGYYSHLTAQDGVQKIAIPESEDPREAEAVPKQEVE